MSVTKSLTATGSLVAEGVISFKGAWAASTNTPTLADGTGILGNYYVVSVAGTQDLGSGSIEFTVGDQVIYNAFNVWQKLESGVGYVPVNKAGDTMEGALVHTNTGLQVQDTNASDNLIIKLGSDLTADRTLTVTTGDADRTLTISGTADVSGTNTGDQTISLTGDVTGSGTGSFATVIANDAVTLAKIANSAASSKLLGSGDTGSGSDYEEITLGANLSMSGTTLNATSPGVSDGDKGDITVSGSGTIWTIPSDTVTYAKMQNISATDKLLGRSTTGSGDVEEITCTAAGRAILDDASAADQRTTLGLVIGIDVQAYDLVLEEIASQTITTESTTSRTLNLTDANDYIRCTNSGATTITIPLNSSVAFPVGTQIDVFQAGAGQVAFAAGAGVTINKAEGLKISAQNKAASLKKVATNEWDLIGALVA